MRKNILLGIVAVLILTGSFWLNQNKYLFKSAKNSTPVEQPGDSALTKLIRPSKPVDGKLTSIYLPEGFSISYFAKDVPGARSLAIGQGGKVVYVGTRDKTVYALTDSDQNGQSESVIKISDKLNTPNGVAFKDGDLYVAEVSRILKYPNIDGTYDNKPKYEVVYDSLPKDTHHGWKYIAFGPDGLLYIPIGAPCNLCLDQGKYARIMRLNVETGYIEPYATGIRNTVGFDWNPLDLSFYFTDNGRDSLGDNTPKDELNRAPSPGMFFGFPFCHGYDTQDPQLGKTDSCSTHTKPVIELGPHVAALGMKFYRGDMFPKEYKNKVIIAEHGSWNRSTPIGYRLTTVDIEGSLASNYQDFVTGWLEGESAWGRPVDLAELPDGSLLISDDKSGAIYRLTYNPKN
jgi:glucose/arabinose dehydrogenase